MMEKTTLEERAGCDGVKPERAYISDTESSREEEMGRIGDKASLAALISGAGAYIATLYKLPEMTTDPSMDNPIYYAAMSLTLGFFAWFATGAISYGIMGRRASAKRKKTNKNLDTVLATAQKVERDMETRVDIGLAKATLEGSGYSEKTVEKTIDYFFAKERNEEGAPAYAESLNLSEFTDAEFRHMFEKLDKHQGVFFGSIAAISAIGGAWLGYLGNYSEPSIEGYAAYAGALFGAFTGLAATLSLLEAYSLCAKAIPKFSRKRRNCGKDFILEKIAEKGYQIQKMEMREIGEMETVRAKELERKALAKARMELGFGEYGCRHIPDEMHIPPNLREGELIPEEAHALLNSGRYSKEVIERTLRELYGNNQAQE